MSFSLSQFDAALGVSDSQGKPFLLIGGQAVYYWATTYLPGEPALKQWLPFTSKDIDFHGGRDDLLQFARQLGAVAKFPHKKEMTAWVGVVQITVASHTTNADFLRSMPGIKASDVARFAVEREFEGRRVRIIDPISLLACKATLAAKVSQKERRDGDHARILVLCVRGFLRDGLRGIERNEISERGWLNAVERVLKLADSSLGRKAVKQLGVDWTQALPLLEIAASRNYSVVKLREKRLPQWAAKL